MEAQKDWPAAAWASHLVLQPPLLVMIRANDGAGHQQRDGDEALLAGLVGYSLRGTNTH